MGPGHGSGRISHGDGEVHEGVGSHDLAPLGVKGPLPRRGESSAGRGPERARTDAEAQRDLLAWRRRLLRQRRPLVKTVDGGDTGSLVPVIRRVDPDKLAKGCVPVADVDVARVGCASQRSRQDVLPSPQEGGHANTTLPGRGFLAPGAKRFQGD